MSADEASQQAVLTHSSRIYDALRVPHDAGGGADLRTVENEGATYVHHAWSTQPLPEDRAADAIARAQSYLGGTGWRTRSAPGRLVAMHPSDETVTQLTTGPDGRLQVGVTGPANPVLHGSPTA